MSEEIELQLLKEIEELKSRLAKFENSQVDITPTYNYSKITFETLNSIVKIEAIDDKNIFQKWFDADIKLDSDILFFLQELLNKEGAYLRYYYEEDLKAKFIIPILNKINFTLIDKKIKDFYEAKLTYKSDKFTLTGTVDYIVSKGLRYNEKPYFFIQEFKKTIEVSDPEPQLLAELISAVELNDFKEIKGAYIIGSIWNFVVLERLERHKYIYYISQNFDSTKPEDLKAIYKNLLFVKLEIIEKVEKRDLNLFHSLGIKKIIVERIRFILTKVLFCFSVKSIMKLTESDQKLLKELCSEYNINYFKVITLLNKVKEYELKDRRSGIYEALKNIIKSDFLMDTA